jgi:hypothetical protein
VIVIAKAWRRRSDQDVHLTIQVIYAANVETGHISTDRLVTVIRNDDAAFTPGELKHYEHCEECLQMGRVYRESAANRCLVVASCRRFGRE